MDKYTIYYKGAAQVIMFELTYIAIACLIVSVVSGLLYLVDRRRKKENDNER